SNIVHYAQRVQTCARKRRLMEAGREAIRLGQDPGLEAEQILELLADRVQQEVEGAGSELWHAPIPLSSMYNLPAFPLDCLPAWLADYVRCLAEATQTPPDLPGILVLSALAACAGGRVRLQVRPGWEEPLNLYSVVALPPGERKSAVFAEVTAPLAEFEEMLAAERSYETAEAKARRKVAEKALDAAQNSAARSTGPERERRLEEVAAAARELQDAVVPFEYRLLADDATPEATASLLAEQRGRLAVLSPEGGIFGQMAGRYSASNGQPNLDVYLKGHSGDMLRVDRKGRAPEYIARPALTVGLAVQPEVLRSLSDQPGFRGRGLLARFLYSLPASRVGSRRTDVLPVPQGVRDTYAAELKALAASLEAMVTAPRVLRLSRQAEAELLAFADELEPRLGENGDLSHIADWGCKLVGGLGRVAALLHLAANVRRAWGEAVGPESVRAAIRIGRYLIPHALAALDLMQADPNLTLARRVLHWILTKQLTSFSRRDCFESMKGRVRRVEALDPILNILEAHGCVRRRVQEPRRRGRPPAPVFDVNPLVAQFAQFAQTELPDSANSANGEPSTSGEGQGAELRGTGGDWERIA
ncbi:MAG: YfjI family protein, partial [Candidatus Dormibacteraeota bacterium]|nr:YfjI family protein [Candidatus Dormibacteraeota bacterium]